MISMSEMIDTVKVQVSLAAFKLEIEGFTSVKRRLEDPEFMNGTNKENYESYNENGENKVANALSMLLEKKLIQWDNVHHGTFCTIPVFLSFPGRLRCNL